MSRLIGILRTVPPRVLVRRVLAAIRDRAEATVERRLDSRHPTWTAEDPGALRPLLPEPPAALLERHRAWVLPVAGLHRRHLFDVLGSGWVEVAHGMGCAGVEGYRYESGAPVTADREGLWLDGRVNPANLPGSRALWRLVDEGYRPIDWHLDIKSGYRWAASRWYRDIPYGHLPGVDVKVPWELSRLHHLVTLAWAQALEGGERWAREFRNQVLDFLATNPPRFGVGWRCTMDVAIRAANLVMAFDLFRATGAVFDAPFEAAVRSALLAHGRHIAANLEWHPEGRGNHYLANLCGLLLVAAVLPASPETEAWLAFSAHGLVDETRAQFLADGANFEASVCYHRLSAEMVVFATAVLAGLPPDRRAALGAATRHAWTSRRVPFQAPCGDSLPPAHFSRIGGMAAFTAAMIKPSGHVAQIGDNDSGRFLKVQPAYTPLPGSRWDEDDLDHRHLLAAAGALLGRNDLLDRAGGFELDAWMVGELAGGERWRAAARACPGLCPGPSSRFGHQEIREEGTAPGSRTVTLSPPGGDLVAGLEHLAWAEFGVYLFRSRRLWLLVRCGSIGQNGRGGHAHNDQLAIELTVDGQDWLADPGTYLYTPLIERRNAYRSVTAHAAPRLAGREPGRLDVAPFWLGGEAKARCLHFGDGEFVGEHHGFGAPVRRRVTVTADAITVVDSGLPEAGGPVILRCTDAAEARRAFGPFPPFSPGYGKLRAEETD